MSEGAVEKIMMKPLNKKTYVNLGIQQKLKTWKNYKRETKQKFVTVSKDATVSRDATVSKVKLNTQ